MDQDAAAVGFVGFAAEVAQGGEAVDGAGGGGLGDLQGGGEAADGVGLFGQIDLHEDGHLARRQVGLAARHARPHDGVPERQGVLRFQLHAHPPRRTVVPAGCLVTASKR